MRITIIGCGLIGGSMALALRGRRPDWPVACLDLPSRLSAIREADVASEVGAVEDSARYLADSSLVILAVPVQEIIPTIERIGPFLRDGTVVTDVGSTKWQIMARVRSLLPPGVHFIGGHPMAGSESSGVEAADPLLFSDRVYLLCPYPDTPPEALLAVMDLAESLLARPVTIDPEEHDRIMATISHLPQLVSVALMNTALTGDAGHSLLDMLAGRGFLDMTRLAAADYSVWGGILEANREAVLEALARFERSLAGLREAVARGETPSEWENAGRRRRRMSTDSPSRLHKPNLRSVIDQCDQQLLNVLGRRLQAVRKMGRLKRSQAAPVRDPDRERRMIHQREEWAKSLALPQELVDELFTVILRHSHRTQAALTSPPDDGAQ